MRQVSWVCCRTVFALFRRYITNYLHFGWTQLYLSSNRAKEVLLRCLQCNGHVSVEHFIKFSSWISSFKIFPIKWHVEEERQAQPVTSYGLQDRKKMAKRSNKHRDERTKQITELTIRMAFTASHFMNSFDSFVHFGMSCT